MTAQPSVTSPIPDARAEQVLFPRMPTPQPPPLIPAGWRIGPPDVVGVGAMHSGTTWWWLLMCEHERFTVGSPRHKELHFFDHHLRVADVDPSDYHQYFPRPTGMVTGEWTPRYMLDYWTPPMLQRVAPDAKLLVLLRDPVERFRSALAFTAGRGFPAGHLMLHQQFTRSLYGQQLRTLLAHFPREQVLVLQYECCVHDPHGQMGRTLDFLGLDREGWHPRQPAGMRVHASRVANPDLDQRTRAALVTAFRVDLEPLLPQRPDLDLPLWPTWSSSGTS